jgi:hypothetical protein
MVIGPFEAKGGKREPEGLVGFLEYAPSNWVFGSERTPHSDRLRALPRENKRGFHRKLF